MKKICLIVLVICTASVVRAEDLALWTCKAGIQMVQVNPITKKITGLSSFSGKDFSVTSLPTAIEGAFDSIWTNSLQNSCEGTNLQDFQSNSASWIVDGSAGVKTICAYACDKYGPPSGQEMYDSFIEVLQQKVTGLLKMPSFTIN